MKKILKKTSLLQFALLLTALCTGSCKKESMNKQQQRPADYNTRIPFVLQDNFSLNLGYFVVNYAGLTDSLTRNGPFTFLAPTNDGFAAKAINTTGPTPTFFIDRYGPALIRKMINGLTLPGAVAFKKLPFATNQEFKTVAGTKIYVSKYISNGDTIITANGIRIISPDNAAANGLIQVTPLVVSPQLYPSLATRIRTDNTTLFAAAMQRAGLDLSLLAGNVPYTVLAPSNDAFLATAALGKNLGISTLDSILKADPVKLANLLKFHIIKGRFFQSDLIRRGLANPSGVTTLNGAKIFIGGSADFYNSITLAGRGNNGITAGIVPRSVYQINNLEVNYTDEAAGNGVLHVITGLLIP